MVRLEQLDATATERDALREEVLALSGELAGARAGLEAAAERVHGVDQLRGELEKAFEALAVQALDGSQQRFLSLANETFAKHQLSAQGSVKEVLAPVNEAFQRLAGSVEALEKQRLADRSTLGEQMRQIGEAMRETQTVTGKLVTALRAAPKTRGAWGEATLRNVLELAGLSAHADFAEQTTHDGDDGKLRPDVVIRLPGGGAIVVDAKVALAGYFEALDASDEAGREAALSRHANQVRAHVQRLSKVDYARFVEGSIDFVAMFIPGENFYAAASERDPELFEFAIRNKVIIVTPATLVALAKAVAYGWRQEDAARNAQEIANLGRALHQRLGVMVDKVASMGGAIDRSVRTYNELVGSLESRVLPSARRFKDLGAGEPGVEIELLDPIDTAPRAIAAQTELSLESPDAIARRAGRKRP